MKSKTIVRTIASILALMLMLAAIPFAALAEMNCTLFSTANEQVAKPLFANKDVNAGLQNSGTAQTDTEKQNSSEIWDGSIASDFAGGSGTWNDPYIISNGAELAYLAQQVNDGNSYNEKCFRLVSDIYLNDVTDWENWSHFNAPANEWTAIGNSNSVSFGGSFDGSGYAVLGIYINNESGSYRGLFGHCIGSTIKDLGIVNCYISAYSYVGGVAGRNSGKITNCYINSAIIRGQYDSLNNHDSGVGGLVGYNTGTIEHCCNEGTIRGMRYVGGIAGYNTGTISKCYNLGTVCGINDGPQAQCAGGVVGYTHWGSVYNCYNAGAVIGRAYVGGVIGYIWESHLSSCCYNVGTVTAYVDVGSAVGGTYNGSFTNFYYLDTCCPNASLHGGTALTEEQMRDANSYEGFDFDNTWIMDEALGRPVLRYNVNTSNELYFEYLAVILDVGESKQLEVHSHDVSIIGGNPVYSNDTIVDNSDLEWGDFLLPGTTGILDIGADGRVTALAEGTQAVRVVSKDDPSLTTSCLIYVGQPNELLYTYKYGSKQYYAEGGFYSEESSISDCVEIYLEFKNDLAHELETLIYPLYYEGNFFSDDSLSHLKDISPITITATVSGNDLSFDRDSYQNTYTATMDAISVFDTYPHDTAADDILMLFPYNINIDPSGNSYTVRVTLESESFDTITEEYTFTVENIETKSANEHIAFITSDADYRVSKENYFGNNMVQLKNDDEYKWSRWSTFDFDNYYEIVLVDIMIGILDANQLEFWSLIPSIIKDWVGTYKELYGGISTIIDDSYPDMFNVSETKIDKRLKDSKYRTDGIYTDDDVFQSILDLLGNVGNAEKIIEVFEKLDKTKNYSALSKLEKTSLKMPLNGEIEFHYSMHMQRPMWNSNR